MTPMTDTKTTILGRIVDWSEESVIRERDRLRLALLGAAATMLAAHAFSFFNFIPQHDALTESFWQSVSHVVGLGRCLLPVYMVLRGYAPMPWVAGMLSILYMGLSVYFISRTLRMNTRAEILLTGGFLGANICVLSINALFQFCLDAYMFSLLTACLGAWLLREGGARRSILAGLCFFVSVGVYTAFITVALCLLMAVLVRDAADANGLPRKMWKRVFVWGVVLAAAAAMYLIACRLSLVWLKVAASTRKTSVFSLGTVGLRELAYRVGVNYYFFVAMQLLGCSPVHHTEFVGVAFGLAGSLLTAVCVLSFCRWQKGSLRGVVCILALAAAALFPLVSRLVPILTGNGGANHTALGQYLFFPMLLWLFFYRREGDLRPRPRWSAAAAVLLSLFIILGNIRFANEAYTLQKVIYDRALYHTGQVVEDLRDAGYDEAAGERVIVTGSFDLGSDLDPQLRKYQDAGVGGFFDTSITYTDTFRSMARLLGSGFRAGGEVEDLQKRLAEMPAYPLDGYLQKENDVYIIKLG